MGTGWERGRAHPFETTGGGGGLISKGCARPRSHPVPIPFPSRSRTPSIRDKPARPESVLIGVSLRSKTVKTKYGRIICSFFIMIP